MRTKRILSLFAVSTLLTACAPAPNPSELLGDEPDAHRGDTINVDGGLVDPGELDADSGASTEVDAAPDMDGGATDAGSAKDATAAVDAAAALGAFSGAPAYVSMAGPTTTKPGHKFPGNTPTTDPAGQSCMTCHKAGGSAPAMIMAGTVYTNAAATTPAGNVEVRLLQANGTVRTAYTNASGNFFLLGAAFAGNAKVGVRDGTAPHSMAAGVTTASCNSCHTGIAGATPRIHL